MPYKDKEKHRAYNRTYIKAYKAAHPEKKAVFARAYSLRRKFNLTLEQYNTLLDSQGFTCALCGVPELTDERRLAVDHCHTTGNIRKLLCKDCNLGLGHFKDDPTLLERAAKYLHYHQKVAQWESE